MKVVVYILLFCFSLGASLPKSDFNQLLKVNYLMEHFELHQNEAMAMGLDLSFSEFLWLHFVEGEEHHEDEQEHDNLPFQNINSSITYCQVASALAPVSIQIHTENVATLTGTILQEELIFDIFHPPCVA